MLSTLSMCVMLVCMDVVWDYHNMQYNSELVRSTDVDDSILVYFNWANKMPMICNNPLQLKTK